MEDGEIIELYWRRDEAAIVHSEEKYGAYCSAIICRILRLPEDVEECLGDTWMAAWNDKARKRGGGEVTAALEELREIGGGSAEEAVEQAELGRLLDRFLRTLPEKECSIFLRRYWFVDSVEEIARRYGLRSGAVKTRLHRTRRKLRDYLQKEGYVL